MVARFTQCHHWRSGSESALCRHHVDKAKMLHDARTSAFGKLRCSVDGPGECPVWAVRDNDEIEKRSDCCAMQISTRRAESRLSLQVRGCSEPMARSDIQTATDRGIVLRCGRRLRAHIDPLRGRIKPARQTRSACSKYFR